MLQIRSIEIFGFQAKSRKAKLQFASDQVSIIYGDNGCGKTTFLKVLHAVLDRKRPTLASERVRAVILKVVNNENTEEVIHINNISKIDDEGQITIDDYDFSELDQSCLGESSSLSLGVERGVTKQSIKIEYQDILRFLSHPKYRPLRNTIDVREFSETFSNYVRNLNVRKYRSSRNELSLDKPHIFLQSVKMENIESLLIDRYRFAKSVATDRIQNALFETLSLVITPTEHNSYDTSKIPDNFEELVLDNKERLIEALNDGIDNNFKSHVVTILHEVVTKRDALKLRDNELLSQLIVNMINELEFEKQLLISITALVDTFNKYLVDGKKLVITTDEAYIKLNGDNKKHSLEYLSSGERHIFTFLSLIVVAGNDKNFLIIDEPEISLNIKWQRTLMDLIRELVPHTQIIVASHSSIIGKKSPHSLVKLQPELDSDYIQRLISDESSDGILDLDLDEHFTNLDEVTPTVTNRDS